MDKPKIKIDIVQDGELISENLIKDYALKGRDIKQLKKNFNCSFVGIVRRGDRLLFSIPKHYMKINDFEKLGYSSQIKHIKNIIQTITKFYFNPEFADHIDKKDLKCDFALKEFYNIYNYFNKYGLYKEKQRFIHKGYQGRISWKETIQRSNKIISKNLIFAPFYVLDNKNIETLVTQCMIFAINYTKSLFDDIIPLPDNSKIIMRGIDQNILNNTKNIINQLNYIQSKIFKDIDKELIRNLIIFFKKVNNISKDNQSFKDYSYSSIWESAVRKYLNLHFVNISKDKIKYSKNLKKTTTRFQKYEKSGYDLEHPDRSLIPDMYFIDNKNKYQYIFDAKYYSNLDKLDYKQLVYHFIFSNFAHKTYNALIIPYEKESKTKIHAFINPEFLPNDPKHFKQIKIYLNYLNMIDVLSCFLNE